MTRVGSEQELVEQLARYMSWAHSGVVYRFDLAADLKLTVGQATRHKRIHPHRGYPDLFIAAPKVTAEVETTGLVSVARYGHKHGLFVELKRDGTRIQKRNGEWASEHIAEQAAMLEILPQAGYAAEFAVGLEAATKLIDDYLGGTS